MSQLEKHIKDESEPTLNDKSLWIKRGKTREKSYLQMSNFSLKQSISLTSVVINALEDAHSANQIKNTF